MRAIRNRYLARSEPGSDDQPSSNATRAAATASVTSSVVACAISASGSSVAGLIVVYVSFGLEPLAADVEAVALAEPDDVARLGRGRVVPHRLSRRGGRRDGCLSLLDVSQR